MYKVPLTTNPNQTFTCSIPINGINKNLKFNLWYNNAAEYWMMSIVDVSTDTEVVANVPLITSKYLYANVLYQLDYKKIGMCFMVPTIKDVKSQADDKNLGTGYVMLWGDNDV